MRTKTVQYLHCKFSNDIDDAFHFSVISFMEIRRTSVTYQLRIIKSDLERNFEATFYRCLSRL